MKKSMIKNSVVRFLRGNAFKMLSFAAILVLLTSCLDDDETPVTPVPLGYVSIYHAAPDAPALDIIVDDNTINNQPFDYTDHSGYLNFRTGDRNLKFSSTNAANALVDSTISVAEGKAYSVFVINTLPSLEILVVEDSSATPASGKAMIRFVHLSPDAPDMVVVGEDGSSVFEGTSFKEATAFKEVDAKNYSFDIKAAASDDVLLSADNINLQAGGYYTIITRGFVTPPGGNTNVLSVEIL